MILNKGSVALIAVQQEEIPVLTQDTGPLLWRYELSLKDRSCSPLPTPPPNTHTHKQGGLRTYLKSVMERLSYT